MPRRTRTVTAAIAIAALSVSSGSARQAAPGLAPAHGTGLIVGRVVDGSTGSAVAAAVVALTGSPLTAPVRVLVDSQGRFVFRNVPAGRFAISSEKNGYAVGGAGKMRIDGSAQPVDLAGGEQLINVTVPMWRLGSITGIVTDESGEPVTDAWVSAFRRTMVGGRQSFSTFTGILSTDDRGRFRVGQVWPGDYLIGVSSRVVSYPTSFVDAAAAARAAGSAATPSRAAELDAKGSSRMGATPSSGALLLDAFAVMQADGRMLPTRVSGGRLWIYPYTFHPSATALESAQIVHVEAGQQRTDVDMRVTLSPTMRISGIVQGPDGPVGNLALRLRLGANRADLQTAAANVAETVTAANGAFTFFGVTRGQYIVTGAVTASASYQGLFASMPVTVETKDVEDLAVALRPALRVSGRVEFDGALPKPTAAQLRAIALAMDAVDGAGARVSLNIDAEGAFRNPNLTPGRYFIRRIGAIVPMGGSASSTAAGGWTLKSAMVNGRDVSDVPLTLDSDVDGVIITFTDRKSVFSGSARSAQGAIDPAATVLIFPVEPAQWQDYGRYPRRLRAIRVDRAGLFVVSDLPPGEYFAIAGPDAAIGDWQDPEFLLRASRLATRVRIADGVSTTIDLRTRQW